MDELIGPTEEELELLGAEVPELVGGGGGGPREPEGGGGIVVLPKDKMAFGSTFVQSVSWLILLTPRRLIRT